MLSYKCGYVARRTTATNALSKSGFEQNPRVPRRRDLFEGVVVIVPAPGMANRKDSTDRTFRLVHVRNVRRRQHHRRRDVGDAVMSRLTKLRR